MTDPNSQKPNGGIDLPGVLTAVVAAAIIGLCGAIIEVSGLAIGWVIAFGVWLLAVVGLVEWRRRRRRRPSRVLFIGWGVVTLALAVAAVAFYDDESDEGPERPAPGLKTVTIFNKVTRGLQMAEDPKPLRLFFSPQLCTSPGCILPGVELRTGNKIDVVCQIEGQEISNGDKTTRADDRNPQLVEDDPIWYGVRTTEGRLVYFSEVWAHPRDRGGLGLTDCSSVPVES